MIASDRGQQPADSGGPTGSRGVRVLRPIRSGPVPPLADAFSARAETAAGLGAALVAGAVVALVPVRVAGPPPGGWLESCGKTQLAVCVAESLWRSREVELLVWVVATSRASVLSGFAEAAGSTLGADPGGDGESAARRFAGWLSRTSRPWLVVLDDLRDVADLEGLWPAGPAGRILITTANPVAFPGEQDALIHPVGVFSPREALSYLMGRLTADPDQRLGAIDLVQDLGCEPLALAQASAVIASSALSCRDYRDYLPRGPEPRAGGPRRPPRSPGRYRSTMLTGCHRAAAPGPCWRWPRCSTATAFPARFSPGRPRTPTWRARAAGSRGTGSRPARRCSPRTGPACCPLTCGRLLICGDCRRAIRRAPRCWSG